MRIAFRADASDQIGTGHIVRCLTLASELCRRGASIVFVTRTQNRSLVEKIRSESYETLFLSEQDSPVGQAEDIDAQETIAALQGQHIDWMIVDH